MGMFRMIDWSDDPPPIEQLNAEAELLRLVEHWRTLAEKWQRMYEVRDYELRDAGDYKASL